MHRAQRAQEAALRLSPRRAAGEENRARGAAALRRGRLQLDPTLVNIYPILSEVAHEQQVGTEKHTITIDSPKIIRGRWDRQRLKQVFRNLLSNAIKYSSHNDISKIDIGFIESNDEVIFSVKDNGVGFDMQYVNKLFGVFQRLHTLSDFEGTGVGLAIVQQIVSKHKGRVWAESVPDKGACFTFTLPLN